MKLAVISLLVLIVEGVYGKIYFKESFDDEKSFSTRWTPSKWKSSSEMGKFIISSGNTFNVDKSIEKGMMASEDAKFYAISAPLDEEISNSDDLETLVVQFSVKNDGKKSTFCGGGYIKLLPKDLDQKKFGGESDYYVMFGPDICGYDVSRVHLIFNYDGKNLLKENDIKLEYSDKDDLTHLYTLVLKKDESDKKRLKYKVLFDGKERGEGYLDEGWDFPKKEIPDESDVKPSDWVDEETIVDPSDTKPDDWDVPERIPDSEAKKPEDWDEEDDGEWEPPMIANPEYKGEWEPKRIKNPAYKGPWVQKTVPNKDYTPEKYGRFKDIGYVGFELWIVNKGSIFDNIIVTDSEKEAKDFAKETFNKIHDKEKSAKEKWDEANKDTAKDDEPEPSEDHIEVEDDEEEDAVKQEL